MPAGSGLTLKAIERVRSFHRKARNVLEDWARKAPLKIARLTL